MKLKEAVFEELAQSESPLGAYEVLASLEERNGKLAPTSIYRALNALVRERRAHRVESMNAFVCCRSEHCRERHVDGAVLSICDDCGFVEEHYDEELLQKLATLTERRGFRLSRRVIEIHGSCGACVQGGSE